MKKIFMTGLILILLFSFACVSAGDINETVAANQNDRMVDFESSHDGEINNAGPVSCIEENGNVMGSENGPANIYFDASADVDGNGSIESPYNTLGWGRIQSNSNLYFKEGYYSTTYSDYCSNVSFYGENPQNTLIDFQNSLISIENSILIKNITFRQASFYLYGDISASNSIFDGNYMGQSVFNDYGNGCNMLFDNCSFVNASRDYYGGVFYLMGSAAVISNCNFADNFASCGGAIYTKWSRLNITNTVFKDNRANVSGGAVFNDVGDLSISNCSFINNSAYCGGAVYIETRERNIFINDSLFYDNSAFAGGCIFVYPGEFSIIYNSGNVNSCVFTIDNCTFADSDSYYGGALTFLGTGSHVFNCNFENNYAEYGGSIYQVCGNLDVSNSEFANNTSENGEAIFVFTMNDVNLTGNNFTGNDGFAIVSDKNLSYRNNNFANDAVCLNFIPDLEIGRGNYTLLKTNDTFNGTLPEKYDPADYGLITGPRSQGNMGYCWDFGTIATLESCILKATGIKFDFSELNVANFKSIFSFFGHGVSEAGVAKNAIAYLLNWLGPIDEKDDFYAENKHLSPILNSLFHIQNAVFIRRDNVSDLNPIKEAILRYGAVGADTFVDGDYFNWSSYYDPNLEGGHFEGHAFSIVGWDDSYSRDNFKVTPPGDGAWIIKNSWAANNRGDGCFYMSYYNPYLGVSDYSLFTFIFNDTIRFDKNYQYDFLEFYSFPFIETSGWYKNIFNSTDDEYLAAVSTYFDSDYDWELYIYVNDEFVHSQSGRNGYGYYTIDLDRFIPLKKNDKFEVIFKISSLDNASAQYPLAYYKLNDVANKSFVSRDNSSWMQMDEDSVLCIKAFTFLNKINTSMDLTVDYNGYDPVNITASVLDEYGNRMARGTVTFDLAGEKFTVDVSNGIANIVHNFNRGLNSISATFNGDGYESSCANRSINVLKIDVEADMNISTHLNTASINVSTSPEITGNGIIYVDGKNYTVKLTGGRASLTVDDLEHKDYTVHFELENKTYECHISKNFTITFSKTRIIAENFTTYQYSNSKYVIRLINETSNVSGKTINFEIDGRQFSQKTDANGEAYVNINMTGGEYVINIEFAGDDEYVFSRNSAAITVIKPNSTLEVSDIVFDYGAVGSADVSITGATGVDARVIGHEEAVVNVAGNRIAVSNLDAGNYTLSVTTVPDANHSAVTRTSRIIVNRIPSNVSLSIVDAEADRPLVINVTASADGQIVVCLDGASEAYNVTANESFAVDFGIVGYGRHYISAEFSGKNHLDSSCQLYVPILFEINESNMNVTVGEINDYLTHYMAVKLPESATGDVVLTINGESYSEPVWAGSVQMEIPVLENGDYPYSVRYEGDDKYAPYEITGILKVYIKPSPGIAIYSLESGHGQAYLPEDATGTVTFTVNNVSYVFNLIDGVADIIVPDLPIGHYSYTIAYSGDDKYASLVTDGILDIEKTDCSLSVSDVEFDYGGVGIADFACSGAIYVTACILNVSGAEIVIENGQIFVSGLDAGVYTLCVTAVPDENHYAVTAYVAVTVNRINSSLSVGDVELDYGESTTVTANAEGAIGVTAKIGGESLSVDNYTILISNLNAGNYTLTVTTIPDANHNAVTRTSRICVNRIPSNVTLTIGEVEYGKPLIVNVTADADGKINVSIDGNSSFYYVKANEPYSIDLGMVSLGLHNISVFFFEDNHLVSSEYIYVPVLLEINESNMNVTVGEINDYFAHYMTVNLPENATGYVYLTLNGDSYSGQLSAGSVQMLIPVLENGDYPYSVRYEGDDKHLPYEITGILTVRIKPSPGISIYSLDSGHVQVCLPEDATGTVTFAVNNVSHVFNLIGGVANITVQGLPVGHYSYAVAYSGDDKYASVVVDGVLDIEKEDSSVSVGDIEFDYGGVGIADLIYSGAINVTAGILNVSDARIIIENGRILVSGLDAGIYTLSVTTVPDENHNAVKANAKVTVNRINSSLSVGDVELDYGESTTVTANAEGATGVTAKIGGESLGVDNYTILISGLNAGNYTLAVTTIPDANHNAVTRTSRICVNRIPSNVTLTPGEVEFDYGDVGIVDFTYLGAINVTAGILNVSGAEIVIENGRILVSGLDAGVYTLCVTAVPDENHNVASANAKVTVNKVNSSLVVDDIVLNYGESYNVSVDIEGADGIVARIDDDEVSVDGNMIQLSGLNPGRHILTVTTVPDANHNPVTGNATVTVNKLESQVIASDLNATVGEEIAFTVNIVSSNVVDGGVVVLFDGETKIGQANVDKGSASLTYTPSKAGNYALLVAYNGTSIYKSSNATIALTVLGQSNNTNASGSNATGNNTNQTGGNGTNQSGNTTVPKIDPEVVVPSLDSPSEDGSVEVKLPTDATGTVTLTVNGEDYVFDVVDGVANVKLPENLTNGDYDYVLAYSGDDKYSSFVSNGTFTVNNTQGNVTDQTGGNATGNGTNQSGNVTEPKVVPEVVVPSLDSPSEDGSVEVKLPTDATGTVTLTVNGEDYVFDVVGGVANVRLPENLTNGDYDYVLVYSGDDKYSSFVANGTFTVNNTQGNVTNQTGGNATGNGTNQSGNVTEPKVVPEVVVPSLDSPSEDGSVEVKLPTDATGTVTLTVNGEDYVFDVVGGVANVRLPENLTNGDYDYVLVYSGDDKYSSFISNGTFTVNKTQENVTNQTGGNGTNQSGNATKVEPEVVVPSLDEPSDDGSVEIILPADATGTVTLTVNGTDYIFEVKNGVANVRLPENLSNGQYPYTLTYSGDEKYSSFAKNGTFTADSKKDPGLAADDITVNVDETGVIAITFNRDATGRLTVNGTEVGAVNGTARYAVSTAKAGIYTYSVKLAEDRHFNASEITVKVTVRKVEPQEDANPFNFEDNKTVESKTLTYSINLPADATGNLTVTVAGKTYTKEVINGTATVEVNDIPAGEYNVTVTYSGDEKYSPIVKSSKATVKVDPVIVAKNLSVQYTGGKYYTITVYGDDGKLADKAKVIITVKGKTFKSLTTKKGTASFKVTNVPGAYNMNITSLGVSVSRTLTVKHIVTLKTVKVKKSAKKLVLQATLSKVNGKYLKNKKVTFKFNGKKYTAKTNKKGIAKVTVKSSVLKKLKVGKKVTYQATYLKDTVKKTVKIKK